MTDDRIRVLIVDDSAFMRRVIHNMIETNPEMDVVGSARDGLDALKKARELNPDVITLDIEMPVMDGLTALENLQKQDDYAVIVVSSHTREGASATIRALELGAFDFVTKPDNIFSMPSEEIRAELAEKIRMAYQSRKKGRKEAKTLGKVVSGIGEQDGKANDLKYLIAIGISTGGPRALSSIMPMFPADIPAAVIVVQHMPEGFTKSLANRLNEISSLTVKEAADNELLKAGNVYIAPGSHHLTLKSEGGKTRIVLSDQPPLGGFRPSVDVMMRSVADSDIENVIAVIMTGMGSDGTKGLIELRKKKKPYVIAQDESTSIVFGMPKVAIESGVVDDIAPLMEIPNRILKYMGVRQ
ncbi:protein-glutamate methylesterase/protein-glutamine glutaminase [Thermoclostridium caenicola]|uniref:Protein-glutamate methylesterase/protein-glutamine glutaminase n=1 Tax=Thermoclostridium caenicola TaxID=659425 RepID=A0A1M6G047_9FIRM|nr:chemotaxis response regulator protein-glutamate methylesterase [Thermoclostridium caenicola]SHJ03234.1 two-component system, chemotaxis family, response regulator CheB [Thermoclostridium caenicola]HPO75856.1 chemotaxis response regulator protein-glutamate methylesterase [Thermoclostridium caenicola]